MLKNIRPVLGTARRICDPLTCGLVVAAVASVLLAARRNSPAIPNLPDGAISAVAGSNPGRLSLEKWHELTSGGWHYGDPSARVQIVLVSNFYCNTCSQVDSVLRAMVQRWPDHVALTYRVDPADGSELRVAAIAECLASSQEVFAFLRATYSHSADKVGPGPARSGTRIDATNELTGRCGAELVTTKAGHAKQRKRPTKVYVNRVELADAKPGGITEAVREAIRVDSDDFQHFTTAFGKPSQK